MHRFLWTILVLALAGSAPALRAQVPQGAGGNAFTCTVDSNTAGNPTICSCSGVSDCSKMAGVCKGSDIKTDDTLCDDEFGLCSCTMGGSRVSPGLDIRPKAEAPASRNAPKEPNVRDHRRTPATTRAGGSRTRDLRPARVSTGQRAVTLLTLGTSPLTRAECKVLGGKVASNSVCNSGSGCYTTDQNGKPHGVCIEVASDSSRRTDPSSRTRGPAGSRESSPAGNISVPEGSTLSCGVGGEC